jgi:ATP-dependent exoDNAse (exonuclease V) beta subunit
MEKKLNLLDTLLIRNSLNRDKNILFDEPTHKYTILTDINSKYTSVTTWVHSHFSHFDADIIIEKMIKGKNWNPSNKYWNMTAEEIKNQWQQNGQDVSSAGTDMHYNIECFMNHYPNTDSSVILSHNILLENYLKSQEKKEESIEWKMFLDFVSRYPELRPYRTELKVYDEELKLSGSIDMIYENPDGSLMIYDWKRCKKIEKSNNFNKFAITECINYLPDTNFWHYSLQLNTYKAILERNYEKKVTDLYLVQLHPIQDGYRLIKCADLSNEISELFEYRKKI